MSAGRASHPPGPATPKSCPGLQVAHAPQPQIPPPRLWRSAHHTAPGATQHTPAVSSMHAPTPHLWAAHLSQAASAVSRCSSPAPHDHPADGKSRTTSQGPRAAQTLCLSRPRTPTRGAVDAGGCAELWGSQLRQVPDALAWGDLGQWRQAHGRQGASGRQSCRDQIQHKHVHRVWSPRPLPLR